jgi:hypothetical protein
MEFAGHVAHIGKKRNAYRVLVGKNKRWRQLGRHRRRRDYRSKLDLKETGWKNVHLINLAQKSEKLQAVANIVRNRSVP